MRLWKLAATAALFACAGLTARAADDDAYYVLGVLPFESKITITQGTLDGDTFVAGPNTETFSGSGGFIVGKLAGGGVLAITAVEIYGEDPNAKTDTFFGAYRSTFAILSGNAPGWAYLPFNLCRRETVLTFTLTPGTATYVTDLILALGNGQPTPKGTLTLSYIDRFEAARAFFGAHHPEFADKVVQGSYNMRPAAHCAA